MIANTVARLLHFMEGHKVSGTLR